MRRAVLPVLLSCSLGLAACGNDDEQAAEPGQLSVSTAFYPLQFLVERIGGPDASVVNLTSPGVEPHDLELTPKQVAALSEDDLVVYLAGFQPAVDDAVDEQARDRALDVATVEPLRGGFEEEHEGEEHEGEEHEGEEHEGEEHEGEESGLDPHVWLDPVRFAGIADAVATRLGEVDPDRAAAFADRAAALRADLEALDAEMSAGLRTCERRELVTSHNAFGYLAAKYDLEQVSLTGLTPDAEASPGTLARVARFARANGVTTVFFEELVSPKVAQTLADEVGAEAVELSPLESAPQTGDYLSRMRTNLTALQAALGCSTA